MNLNQSQLGERPSIELEILSSLSVPPFTRSWTSSSPVAIVEGFRLEYMIEEVEKKRDGANRTPRCKTCYPFPAVPFGFCQECQSAPSRSAIPKNGSDDLRNAAYSWSARIAEVNKTAAGRWSALYLAAPCAPDRYPRNNDHQPQDQQPSAEALLLAKVSVDAALQNHLEKLNMANAMRTATIDPWER